MAAITLNPTVQKSGMHQFRFAHVRRSCVPPSEHLAVEWNAIAANAQLREENLSQSLEYLDSRR